MFQHFLPTTVKLYDDSVEKSALPKAHGPFAPGETKGFRAYDLDTKYYNDFMQYHFFHGETHP